jgi:hypothetical protein
LDAINLNRLKEVAMSCRRYAEEHQGSFPANLSDLVPKYLPDDKTWLYITSKGRERKPWHYAAGLSDKSPEDFFLLWSPVAIRGGTKFPSGRRLCARLDTRCGILREEDFSAEMKRQGRERELEEILSAAK